MPLHYALQIKDNPANLDALSVFVKPVLTTLNMIVLEEVNSVEKTVEFNRVPLGKLVVDPVHETMLQLLVSIVSRRELGI
jgi:hypothetical protein